MTIEWNGPKAFREKMFGRLPTLEEWIAYLEMKLEEAKEGWDDQGSFDFHLGRTQEYVQSWPQIFDEGGGI